MSVVTEEQKALMEEVKGDLRAYGLLRSKADWEHMTLFAVLNEWGDPRTWNSYNGELTAGELRNLLDFIEPNARILNPFVAVIGKKSETGFTAVKKFQKIRVKKHSKKDYFIEAKGGSDAYILSW